MIVTSRFVVGIAAAATLAGGLSTLRVSGSTQAQTGQGGGATPAAAGQTQGGSGAQQAGAGRGRGQLPDVPLISPGPSAARFPKNADEFDQMFNQVKNWGRWGPNDQLGAANLITDAKRKQALALGKQGIVVGLAHSPLTEPAPDVQSPFEHTMNRGFTTDTYK